MSLAISLFAPELRTNTDVVGGIDSEEDRLRTGFTLSSTRPSKNVKGIRDERTSVRGTLPPARLQRKGKQSRIRWDGRWADRECWLGSR